MRTTLTIDTDVAAELERLRQGRNVNFKELVNDVLRRGLRDITAQKRRKPFRTRSVDCGRLLIDSVDNVAEVLAYAEGEEFK